MKQETYKVDKARLKRALRALDASKHEANPEYPDLPEALPIPTRPDETVAIVYPRRKKAR
jgi:hypothetical protein